jgi:hypothetical protein
MAPDIAYSIRVLGRMDDTAKGELVGTVANELIARSLVTVGYTATWLLEAFRDGAWPDREKLVRADEMLSVTAPARRELLLALKGLDQVQSLAFNSLDPWHVRAFEWSTKKAVSRPEERADAPGSVKRWTSLLDAAIIETDD